MQTLERATSPTRSPNPRRTGIGLAVLTMIVSGFAVFVNGYGVRAWADFGGSGPYTTAKNIVAAAILGAGYVLLSRRSHQQKPVRPTRPSQWAGLLTLGVIGGSVPFLLFFEGLSQATSANAAFIHKTLVLWVALLAIPLLSERFSPWHVGSLALLLGGHTVLAGGLGGLTLGVGEQMMLAATLLWAFEVILAKRLLADLAPSLLAISRMGFGVVILIAYGLATGSFAAMAGIGFAEWGWVLLTGTVLSAYVATWYSALARVQAIDVSAIIVGGAVITASLQTGIRGVALPSPIGLTLLACGAALVIFYRWRQTEVS